jgi:hypothetical protein
MTTLLEACCRQSLFAPWFKNRATWQAWFVFIAALFALPMTEEQLAIYQQCTGRSVPPASPAKEAWLVCGRRAGKSFVLALVAVFLACFRDYRQYLAPGERGTIVIIAADRKQSRVIFRYIRALLLRVEMLAQLVERETAEAFDLKNGVTIEVATASFRSTRGYTLVAILADEISFWPTDDSADPDFEVLNALRPGTATIPGAMLLAASSPYARRGALWDAHRNHFGKDNDPVLVWQAPTRVMNGTVPQLIIDKALRDDPSAGAAEYLAEFRIDIESFISREVIDAAVIPGRRELPYVSGSVYYAWCDPSGGSKDSMTLAIVHGQDQQLVLDLVREREPPFSPDAVAAEFSALCKAYGITRLWGDRFAGEWPRERFRVHGVEYQVSGKDKSKIYGETIPLFNSGRVELLDHPRLVAQFCSLERRTARGGRDSIDHPAAGHDDICNAVSGALVAASQVNADDEMTFATPGLFVGGVEVVPAAIAPTGNGCGRILPGCEPFFKGPPEPWEAYTRQAGFWSGLPAASYRDRKPW